MIFKPSILFFFAFILSSPLLAQINVVATLSDLATLVEEVGNPYVKVESICKGKKDPHFLSAKPSYIMKVSRADLVVANGLDLETGWLPKLLSAARNPKVVVGSKGYLEVGKELNILDVPNSPISRAHGDVHSKGNPHVTLDPKRVGEIAVVIAHKLSQLAPKHSDSFEKKAQNLQKRLKEKTKEWQKRIEKTGIKSVVTYHETLVYFLNRFNIEKAAILEPFPGVPPTAKHTLNVIKDASKRGTKLILIEQYFDPKAAKKPASQIPGVQVATVPVAVQKPKIPNSEALFEALVKTLEHHKVKNNKKLAKKVAPDKKNKLIYKEKETPTTKIKTQLPLKESKTPPSIKTQVSSPVLSKE